MKKRNASDIPLMLKKSHFSAFVFFLFVINIKFASASYEKTEEIETYFLVFSFVKVDHTYKTKIIIIKRKVTVSSVPTPAGC